jgi:hypothetical protein
MVVSSPPVPVFPSSLWSGLAGPREILEFGLIRNGTAITGQRRTVDLDAPAISRDNGRVRSSR